MAMTMLFLSRRKFFSREVMTWPQLFSYSLACDLGIFSRKLCHSLKYAHPPLTAHSKVQIGGCTFRETTVIERILLTQTVSLS